MARGSIGKYSLEKVEEICKWIALGNNNKDAAGLSDISEATFYGWQQEFDADGSPNPEYHLDFLEAVKKAELQFKARHIAYISRAAVDTWQASAWILERRYRNEYAIKNIQEHTGANGQPLELLVVNRGGFLPADGSSDAPPAGSDIGVTPAVQVSGLAQEVKENNNSDIRDDTSGVHT